MPHLKDGSKVRVWDRVLCPNVSTYNPEKGHHEPKQREGVVLSVCEGAESCNVTVLLDGKFGGTFSVASPAENPVYVQGVMLTGFLWSANAKDCERAPAE